MRRADEVAQVDFGAGAPVVTADASAAGLTSFASCCRIRAKRTAKPPLPRQPTISTALENAFAHFGGVPKTLVIDNLKAAVAHPDWFDPELSPKVQSFCQHYGTVILPTKAYTPRHKGKVEAGVKYVKNNALKGRVFDSLEAENRFLANWETNVADKRYS
jgi:transposase